MEVGIRVVRGPDWEWGDQDGGEGFVGTVVEIGREKTVMVQWDCGTLSNYRIGYQNYYDLLIWDNAPVGVKHPNFSCDSCKRQGIQGLRWKCKICHDFDLCMACYMGDKHDLNHPFFRFDSPFSQGVEVPSRAESVRIPLKGIFPSAKVIRGPNWDWGNQDGGQGKIGSVLDIRGWDSESGRSVANVMWSCGNTNVYRLGHKGKVDILLVQPASGGFYYKSSLPVLGKPVDSTLGRGVTTCGRGTFAVGEKVQTCVSMERLKTLQQGHGGWNPLMMQYIGKVGSVHRVTDKGDIRVQYENPTMRWTYHPSVLMRVPDSFSIGDVVRVSDDEELVRRLQRGHGEWTDDMKMALGRAGKVIQLYEDGDLRVTVSGHDWTLNPLCVSFLPGSSLDLRNSMDAPCIQQQHNNPLESLSQLLQSSCGAADSMPDRLVSLAAQGNLEGVEAIVNINPERVDAPSRGKTALQVSCHQGHLPIVEFLLSKGANMEVRDAEGDRPIHYASFGTTAGHVSNSTSRGIVVPTKGVLEFSLTHHLAVGILLNESSTIDVNVQDSYGDTALHDAIGKESPAILGLLLSKPGIDVTLRNRRGFHPLHHAALKGNAMAVEKMLESSPQLVNSKKDDGFSALHLAALNGHLQITERLLRVAQCEVDVRNNRRQTPLMLTLTQFHIPVGAALLRHGADVNAVDEEGNSTLHLVLTRLQAEEDESSSYDKPRQVVEFLLASGANPDLANAKGETPRLFLPSSLKNSRLLTEACGTSKTSNPEPCIEKVEKRPEECLVCCEAESNIRFEPCGHSITCEECCVRMKKCIVCSTIIVKKFSISDGRPVKRNDRLRYLEERMAEMEEYHMCSICMERRRNVAFLCGHGACVEANSTEVKKAFRKLSLVLHPDKNDAPDAEIKFRQLAAVYEVLRDEKRRARYDQVLIEGLPTWRMPVYYFRRVRKMGMGELAIFLSVLCTIGHYLMSWAAYWEKKLAVDQQMESWRKKRGKKRSEIIDQEMEDLRKNLMESAPRPRFWNLLPFLLAKGIWCSAIAAPEMIRAWREQKALKEAETDESEEEEDVAVKREKRPRRRQVEIPEYEGGSSSDEASNTNEEKTEEKDDEIRTFKREERQGGLWTDEDFATLVRLMKKYPGGVVGRWEKIAEAMDRTVYEVTHMAKRFKDDALRPKPPPEEPEKCVEITENTMTIRTVDGDEEVIMLKKPKVKTRKPETVPSESSKNDTWTASQQKALEAALIHFPKGTDERWELISNCVPGKSKEECMQRFRFIAETVKQKRAQQPQ
ncbi:unnamed protein product [Darwinula stevensoni]|uniref:RING-type E3 ubiquitin transferase n=1 Tax=Darwinula stevensoni TaxID=69355 RepID=A0A7R9FPU4_9CRUS|nr:unnamed protein product [Darwinula stevensoni]CAG0898529.1 unnamed protein product [Darwinula stevensoni]